MLPPALPEVQSEFRPLINLLIYRSKLDDTASELAVRPYEPAGNLELGRRWHRKTARGAARRRMPLRSGMR